MPFGDFLIKSTVIYGKFRGSSVLLQFARVTTSSNAQGWNAGFLLGRYGLAFARQWHAR